MQSRLLRVLEDHRIDRLGGEESVEIDVRVIAATNADLEEMIAQKFFRQDLYYRLKVLKISLPPLRERREDIPVLSEHFVKLACEKTGRPAKTIDPDAVHLLRTYDWPGNVRELQNLMEMLVVTVDAPVLQAPHIAKELFSRMARTPQDLESIPAGNDFADRISAFERQLLQEALERNQWNKVRTAKELGWHRNTVDYKIRKLGITRKEESSNS
jgi:two-component system nitrogen regulation response regulator NtrX